MSSDEKGDKHWIQQVVSKLAEVFPFLINLLSHPIKTTLSQLTTASDAERVKEAIYFFAAMLAVWFLIEVPLFLLRGIKAEVLSGVLFFLLQLVAYTFIATMYAVVLHFFLRVFGVCSDLLHTIPCYFYTSVAIPFYAILVYPVDLLKYRVIDKAGTITVLVHPNQYAQIEREVLDQLGRRWGMIADAAGIATDVLSIAVFLFLSVVLSKWYKAKYWRSFVATLIIFVMISLFEHYVLDPVSAQVEVLFAHG